MRLTENTGNNKGSLMTVTVEQLHHQLNLKHGRKRVEQLKTVQEYSSRHN